MKTILTLVFGILISTAAMANTNEVKVKTITKGVNLEVTINKEANDKEVARLYRRKNSRVKKELKFSTKANRPKMA